VIEKEIVHQVMTNCFANSMNIQLVINLENLRARMEDVFQRLNNGVTELSIVNQMVKMNDCVIYSSNYHHCTFSHQTQNIFFFFRWSNRNSKTIVHFNK
jgi:hypothetical protein